MNKIVSFSLCTLSDKQLVEKVDKLTDEMYTNGRIPDRHIPARPDKDYDLLVGELCVRFLKKTENKEFIVCSVVKYDNHNVCGLRHSDCYETIEKLTGKKVNELKGLVEYDNMKNGFMTSTGRFVSRSEGWRIAIKNNQVQFGKEASDNGDDSILISENLY